MTVSCSTAVIMLVEHDVTVRDLADEVLRDLGHRVILAEDGAAALRRLEAGEQVDVIVTDIGLSGGVSGYRLIEEARLSRPGLKVLFITGYADEAEVAVSAIVPGIEVLSKPFQVRALADCVERLLEPQQDD